MTRPPSTRILRNVGNDRVIDFLREKLARGSRVDLATTALSIFALGELLPKLEAASAVSLLVPGDGLDPAALLGDAHDRTARNSLQSRWHARRASRWFAGPVEVRAANDGVAQSAVIVSTKDGTPAAAVTGNCPLTSAGLGLAPSKRVSLVQAAEGEDVVTAYREWFLSTWSSLPPHTGAALTSAVAELAAHTPPSRVYLATLAQMFHDSFGARPTG